MSTEFLLFIILLLLAAILGILRGVPLRKNIDNLIDKYIENFFSEENISNYLENFFDPIVRDYLILKKHNPSVVIRAMRFKKASWGNSSYYCLADCDKNHVVFVAYDNYCSAINTDPIGSYDSWESAKESEEELLRRYHCFLYEFITGKSYEECQKDFTNTDTYKTFSFPLATNGNTLSSKSIDSPCKQFTFEKYEKSVGGPSKLAKQNYVQWKNHIESKILDDLAEMLKKRYATEYPNLRIKRNEDEITFYCP